MNTSRYMKIDNKKLDLIQNMFVAMRGCNKIVAYTHLKLFLIRD